MIQTSRSVLTVTLLALALTCLGSTAVRAQDQQQRPQDQARHDNGAADVERYRKAHPRAAARCHDGFFTNTTDRSRACSKHGGIDVWLRK